MKQVLCILIALCMILSGCAPALQTQETKQYTATFLNLFDTVTTIVGKSESKETFESHAQAIHDALLEYHQLFDIYHSYEGIANLKTVNDQAAIAPVKVDQRVLDLLSDCKQYAAMTGGKVNAAMGSVLSLWHEARADGINDPLHAQLPSEDALKAAAEHCNFDDVILDAENCTVFFRDPQLQLDVGSIAKGWSVQQVAMNAPSGLLISVGGNVCATGPKEVSGTPWIVGIQDPKGGSEYLHTIQITSGSVVTSGDYQRTYAVDGKFYHHIIDSTTLYPSSLWSSVTIVCPDSGLADALSTALFLLPIEEGQALLDQCHAEALWVNPEGNLFYSPGFRDLIRT